MPLFSRPLPRLYDCPFHTPLPALAAFRATVSAKMPRRPSKRRSRAAFTLLYCSRQPPLCLRPAPGHAYRPPTPPVAAPPHPHRHHWRPSHRCTPPAASDGHSAHRSHTHPSPTHTPSPTALTAPPHRAHAPPDSAILSALAPPRRPSHPSPSETASRASPTAQYRPAPPSLQSAPPTRPPCPTVRHTQIDHWRPSLSSPPLPHTSRN